MFFDIILNLDFQVLLYHLLMNKLHHHQREKNSVFHLKNMPRELRGIQNALTEPSSFTGILPARHGIDALKMESFTV